FKPAGGEARKPAIVYIHGGGPRQMLLGWHYRWEYANDYGANQYLASRGFIVLSVDYRLSVGYGQAFQFAENTGARGATEYRDILAAGRYLQSRPDVDPARIGVWGASLGGYLTALALGRNSDVFAAGVDMHGVHDRLPAVSPEQLARAMVGDGITEGEDRKSTRLNSSHVSISYAVFCLKKKNQNKEAFYNVIKNSLEATKQPRIPRIPTDMDETHLIDRFTTTGACISSDNLSKVFAPYF